MTAEKWGDFHLRNTVGHITVSTMWDGNDKPGGPFETIVFGMGPEQLDNPTVRTSSREAAITRHTSILNALGRLQRFGVL